MRLSSFWILNRSQKTNGYSPYIFKTSTLFLKVLRMSIYKGFYLTKLLQ